MDFESGLWLRVDSVVCVLFGVHTHTIDMYRD